jgi:hypothetical protein
MPDAIVLAIHAEHADAILDGTARFEHRALPPKRLPAKAYLAVVEERAIVGECDPRSADPEVSARLGPAGDQAPPVSLATSIERLRPREDPALVPLRRGLARPPAACRVGDPYARVLGNSLLSRCRAAACWTLG